MTEYLPVFLCTGIRRHFFAVRMDLRYQLKAGNSPETVGIFFWCFPGVSFE